MNLTVAICTWNRADLLRQTLDAFRAVRDPEDVRWELLVVDNNSTDETKSVVERFARELPLRYLFEPRPGKSHALNAAVAASTGDYILWTDDDVIVDPDWTREYAAAFRAYPDAAFFGGTIDPWFEGDPPGWLKEAIAEAGVGGAYAILAAPEAGTEIGAFPMPFGANMATRRTAHEGTPFDTSLGPTQSGAKRVGEETQFMRTLQARGDTGRWAPGARVRHLIPHHRQTLRYLRDYHIGIGAILPTKRANGGPDVFGRPLWLWKQAFANEVRYQLRRWYTRPSVWIHYLIQASQGWGGLLGNRAFRAR